MVRRSLDPWLAHILQAEISLVLDWWRSVCNGIKPDPESRFSNDYSNFRSVLETSPANNHMVQLIEVLSLDDTPIVLLSDSKWKIKARLSHEAVAALEAETGEKLSLDVTGDVFHLRKFTVISTHLSISDDYVQLFVDNIDYAHHLRRTEGSPRPIAQYEGISLLIKEIERLRSSEVPYDSKDDVAPSQGSLHDATASIAVPRSSPFETQQSIPPLQSQHQRPRRAAGPSLIKDGFSIESGLNLETPFQGIAGLSRHERLPGMKSKEADNERRDRLLGILGARPQDKPRVTRQEAIPQPSPILVSETPTKHVALTSQVPLVPPPAAIASPALQDGPTNAQTAEARYSSQSNHVPSAESVIAIDEVGSEPAIVKMPLGKVIAAQSPQSPSMSPQAHDSFHSPPSRRKIPAAQRKLLDHPSSWFPPLPGQRFPHPNVPIELLKAWNSSMIKTSSPKHTTPKGSQNLEGGLPHSSHMSAEDLLAESSDDEPLNASQWPPSQPPTPSQRRPDLPPDSSFNSPARGDEGELQIAAPRTLPVRKSPHRPDRQAAPVTQKVPVRPPLPAKVPAPEPTSRLPSQITHKLPQKPSVNDIPHSSPRSVLSQMSPSEKPSSQQEVSFLSRDPHARDVSRKNTSKPESIQSSPPSQERPDSRSGLLASRARPPSRETSGIQHERGDEAPIPIQSSVYPDYWKPSYGSPKGPINRNHRDRPSASNILSPWRNRPMVGRRFSPSQTSPTRADLQQENDMSGRKSLDGTPSSQRSVAIGESLGRRRVSDAVDGDRSPQRLQDPDDTHRHARREFVQQQKRKRDMERSDWLKSRYHPSTSGITRFQTALAEYRRSHESDQSVSAHDFMKAAQMAFPASNVTLGTLFLSRNGDENNDETMVSSNQACEPAQTSQKMAPQNGANGQARPSSHAASSEHADGSGSRLKNNVAASTMVEGQDMMKEFCDSWLNIRPGGAFAVEVPRRQARRHVNLLAWDV